MGKRVDVLMGNGARRRAVVEIEGGAVALSIGGIELRPDDHAMSGARVVVGDQATLAALAGAGWRVVQAGNVTVAARLPRETSEAMAAACEARGLSMSAALTAAARAWLAAGCPFPCDNSASHKGCGQRG